MRPTRFLLLMLLIPASVVLAADDEAVLKYLPPQPGQEGYRTISDGASEAGQTDVEVQGQAGQTLTPIVDIADPPVSTHRYCVRGRVKYENVAGTAYLEMWSDFGKNGAFFSRGLAEVGPMRAITGSSPWRDFELPFYAEPGMRLERLTINVVMPGPGTITIGPLTLGSLEAASAWWSEPQGGLVGGLGGGALGLIGAAVGILASRRRARGVVMSLIAAGFGCGAFLVVAGIIALCLGQPFFVAFPLLLVGGISTVVLGGLAPSILRRYRADEFRRMAALVA